jgi:hypothetical protein
MAPKSEWIWFVSNRICTSQLSNQFNCVKSTIHVFAKLLYSICFCLWFSFGKDHSMFSKILLALGVVLAISALGKKIYKFSVIESQSLIMFLASNMQLLYLKRCRKPYFSSYINVTRYPFWRVVENRYCALKISPIFIKFSPNVSKCICKIW